jgi:hypothetical protein
MRARPTAAWWNSQPGPPLDANGWTSSSNTTSHRTRGLIGTSTSRCCAKRWERETVGSRYCQAVHRGETAGESDELTWHEPKDADLAVGFTALDNLGELRKARRQFQPLHLVAMAAAPPVGLVLFDRRLEGPPDFAFDDVDVPF